MKYKIVIVDNSLETQTIFRQILSKEDYILSFADNQDLVFNSIEKQLPDLFFIDLHFIELNGIELCKRLKSNSATQNIPIILMSDTTESVEWNEGIDAGAVDCFLKPPNALELQIKIRSHLRINQKTESYKQIEMHLQLLKNTIDTTSESVYWINSEGKLIYINSAASKNLGYTQEEMSNMSISVINPLATTERWKEIWEIIKVKKNINIESIHRRKDGTEFPVEIVSSYILSGNEEYINGFAREITERKNVEAILRKNESQLLTFISNAPTAIAMFDNDLRYLAYSERWLKDYDLHGQDLKGKHHYDIFPSIKNNEFWKEIHDRCLAGESIKKDEDIFYGINGLKTWIRWDVRPWHLSNGDIGGIIMLTESITARKMAEIDLAERNRFIESLMDLSPGIIYIYDILDKKNIYSNGGIQKILGYSMIEVKEMGSQLIPLLMHPDDFQIYLENIAPKYLVAKDNEQIVHQYRMKHKTGIWRWLESIEAIYQRLSDKSPKQIFGTVTDITDRKMGEDALKSLATSFAKLSGKDFFREVSKHIATVAGLDCVFVGELDSKKENITVQGGYFLGEWLEMSYALSNTPCERVMENSFCFHPNSVQSLFPNDIDLVKMKAQSYIGSPILNKQNEAIGLMVTIHSKELTNPATVTNLFNLFIDRVAAEMLRAHAEVALKLEKEKVEENERTLRAMYENSQDAIIISQNSRIVMANQAYLDLLGLEDKNILIGKSFLDYISPREHEKIKQLHKNRNLGLDVPNFYETIGIRYNGEEFPFDVKVGTFEVNNQKFTIAIVRDISDRKKAEIELENHRNKLEELVKERTLELLNTIQRLKETQSQLVQSEKLASLGILTAGIAHEINNPINYINSSIISLEILAGELIDIIKAYETITTENIQEKLKEIEKLKESINLSDTIEGVKVLSDNIKIGAKKTADIVKSLRIFSRTDSDKQTLANVNESIDSTLILLHNQYVDRIEIIKEYEILPAITCFPGKLNQVIMNLLANAIQAIEGKGKIHIKTTHMKLGFPDFKKECIYISIRDSGLGIPHEIQNKVFEPFFTTKETGKGTGLGLAISYGIMEQHKGKIEFSSEIGKGTEFKIFLPI